MADAYEALRTIRGWDEEDGHDGGHAFPCVPCQRVDLISRTLDERGGLIPVRLVPVQVFGADQCCEHNPHGAIDAPDCEAQGYGLSDAVSAWSDCNRAVGHIYRFDDLDPNYREAGETLTVWVDPDEYRAFAERKFGDG